MSINHPARQAARKSMAIVEAKGERAKEAWLALFAEDAVVEDPIGPSPLDPHGRGHRGKQALGEFWDAAIEPVSLSFEIEKSFACGNEVANVGSITTRLSDGSRARVEGVFTYCVDDQGKIVALRAYWELEAMLASLQR